MVSWIQDWLIARLQQTPAANTGTTHSSTSACPVFDQVTLRNKWIKVVGFGIFWHNTVISDSYHVSLVVHSAKINCAFFNPAPVPIVLQAKKQPAQSNGKVALDLHAVLFQEMLQTLSHEVGHCQWPSRCWSQSDTELFPNVCSTCVPKTGYLFFLKKHGNIGEHRLFRVW